MKKETIERLSLFIAIVSTSIALIQGWGSMLLFLMQLSWILGFMVVCSFFGILIGSLLFPWVFLLDSLYERISDWDIDAVVLGGIVGAFLAMIGGLLVSTKITPVTENPLLWLREGLETTLGAHSCIRLVGWITMIPLFFVSLVYVFGWLGEKK